MTDLLTLEDIAQLHKCDVRRARKLLPQTFTVGAQTRPAPCFLDWSNS